MHLLTGCDRAHCRCQCARCLIPAERLSIAFMFLGRAIKWFERAVPEARRHAQRSRCPCDTCKRIAQILSTDAERAAFGLQRNADPQPRSATSIVPTIVQKPPPIVRPNVAVQVTSIARHVSEQIITRQDDAPKKNPANPSQEKIASLEKKLQVAREHADRMDREGDNARRSLRIAMRRLIDDGHDDVIAAIREITPFAVEDQFLATRPGSHDQMVIEAIRKKGT